MAKHKFYVVWKGHKPGIYSSWAEAEKQVRGAPGAEYKAFGTLQEAEAAFRSTYESYRGRPSSLGKWRQASVQPILPSLCVDAACSGSPGTLEYRGVFTESGDEIFHFGPFADGTNNVGEFLAIVYALTWMARHDSPLPVYSDSENGIAWVYAGKCKTSLKHTPRNAPLFARIRNAESWLAENKPERGAVLKWDTERWGEIPADFGRK